jgi:hypothetical protein
MPSWAATAIAMICMLTFCMRSPTGLIMVSPAGFRWAGLRGHEGGQLAGGSAVVCGELAGEVLEQFIDRRRDAVLWAEPDDLAVEVIGLGGSVTMPYALRSVMLRVAAMSRSRVPGSWAIRSRTPTGEVPSFLEKYC